MKKPAAETKQEKTEIEQLSQAELVELVLGLQKIIEELQEKLAIATGKNRTNRLVQKIIISSRYSFDAIPTPACRSRLKRGYED